MRYSTTGSNAWENSQPVHRCAGDGGNRRELALAHNGNLINAVELHAELRERGVAFRSTSDSEIIAALLATHPADDVEDAIADVHAAPAGRLLDGRHDQRPRRRLPRPGRACARSSLGQLGDRYCVASESCAFDIIGAELLRDVAARRDRLARASDGMQTRQVVEGAREAFCVFEYIYFARPGLAHGRQGRCRPRAGGWARSSRARRRRRAPTS